MKVIYFILVVILSITIYLYFEKNTDVGSDVAGEKLEMEKSFPILPKSFPDNTEYVKGTVESAIKYAKQQQHIEEVKKTDDYKKFRGETLEKLEELKRGVEENLPEVIFYGQIVDQDGVGVVEVPIRYAARNAFTSSKNFRGRTKTNQNGGFIVEGIRGSELNIVYEEKFGYEYPKTQNFVESDWLKTRVSEPYTVNAWRINRYPKVSKGNPFIGLVGDGRTYILDFLSTENILIKNSSDGDLQIRMNRSETDWNLEITAIDGGLQETSDNYRYLAPESGYVSTLRFSGNRVKKTIYKNIYMKSRNGSVYGTIRLKIKPYYQNESAVKFEYVINLEKGRNLSVKQ